MPQYLENDDALAKLVEHMRETTPLKNLTGPESHQIFVRLRALGYLWEPDKHPSGLETNERAMTCVVSAKELHKVVPSFRHGRRHKG